MSARLDKAIAAGVCVAIVFTALAYGAVEPWSIAAFELIVVALVGLWFVKSLLDARVKIAIPATALPLAALFLLGLAQSVSFTDGAGRTRSLSMDVDATRAAVTVLFFLLALFVIAANFFGSRERLHALVNFLVIYGLAMAVFALVQHFTWEGRFYWLRPTAYAGSQFGPFVNRNHFAGYMELLAPIPVALIFAGSVRRESWGFYGFAAAVMGLAVVLSLSRGGMLSLAAGLAFVAAASVWLSSNQSAKAPRLWLRAIALIPVLAAIVAGVIWIGTEPLINRAAQTIDQVSNEAQTDFYSRVWIWKDTLALIGSNPIFGSGLGSFQTVYPIYAHSNGSMLVSQAHNDYLQALADCGIIGGAIALWFIVALFRAVSRGIKSRDPLLSGLALGIGAGIFSMLVHSLFDFNLQILSNALMFLFLSAVASKIGAIAKEKDRESALRLARQTSAGGLATGVSS